MTDYGEHSSGRTSPMRSKSEGEPKERKVTILGIVLNEKKSLEACHEKFVRLLRDKNKALSKRVCNNRKVQELLGCWNWDLLLASLAIPVL